MRDTTPRFARIDIDRDTAPSDAAGRVRTWVQEHVPVAWRDAAAEGGARAIRQVRTRAAYEEWYPVFGWSGLVVPTWPVAFGGLDVTPAVAKAIEAELTPCNLGRLNPLGLNLAAPALFAHGTDAQRERFLPPLVRNEEVWCQLFSEPGAGSDLASLATRAERDGDGWRLTGQKVWTTWAHVADLGVALARTDPDVPKRRGITYFLVDLHQPGVEVRPLRHITGEIDFNEVFLDGAWVPDAQRVGAVGDGWRVANATLSGERQMVSGSGSGGVDRIGGSGAERLVQDAAEPDADSRWSDPMRRQALMRVVSEERIRAWTNQRVRSGLKAGRPPGPESSIGKVHQGALNQRIQLLAVDAMGPDAMAWEPNDEHRDGEGEGAEASTTATSVAAGTGYDATLPFAVKGMLRSRANTIEGGTTEVNKNIVGERVLGLPREPDPFNDAPWREVPRG
jgi:alkylation response protein AidB-like acyl-CoA dehydrogenase